MLYEMFLITPTKADRWIDRGGSTAWPPCPSDLNPLDFYLWGHLKILVYAAPVDNKEAAHHHILDAYQTICSYPSILERIQCSIMRRVEVCIVSYRGYFEPQIKCSQMYVYKDIFFSFRYVEPVPKVCLLVSVTTCMVSDEMGK
jgi:hypothetical protein